MAEIEWREAPPSVINTAEYLIERYHPHLTDARIAFVMRSENQKRGDRVILAATSKVPAKMQTHFEYDFLIWVSEPAWEEMDSTMRDALIDHELCHCAGNVAFGWKLRDHDIQEFATIISRYGFWNPTLERIDKALTIYQQEVLPGVERTGKIAAVEVRYFTNVLPKAEEAAPLTPEERERQLGEALSSLIDQMDEEDPDEDRS